MRLPTANPNQKVSLGALPCPSFGGVIGFIGLGQMGTPLVANLLADGYRVRVWNRTAEKAVPLVEKGAQQAGLPRKPSSRAGSSSRGVANDQVLESIFSENPAIFQRLGTDGLHVSMSTVHPETSAPLGPTSRRARRHYVARSIMGRPDAVAGSHANLPDPRTGRCGGPRAADPGAVLGRQAFEFGEYDPGAANVAKLAANFLIAASIESLAEAFHADQEERRGPGPPARDAHRDALRLPDLQRTTAGRSSPGSSNSRCSALCWGRRIWGWCPQLAFDSRTPMPLGSLLRDRYTSAAAHGRGDWDWTAIAAVARPRWGWDHKSRDRWPDIRRWSDGRVRLYTLRRNRIVKLCPNPFWNSCRTLALFCSIFF